MQDQKEKSPSAEARAHGGYTMSKSSAATMVARKGEKVKDPLQRWVRELPRQSRNLMELLPLQAG